MVRRPNTAGKAHKAPPVAATPGLDLGLFDGAEAPDAAGWDPASGTALKHGLAGGANSK